ncbi:MAG: hypothetical protein AAF499_11080 [Pseudomonadota bacterium]
MAQVMNRVRQALLVALLFVAGPSLAQPSVAFAADGQDLLLSSLSDDLLDAVLQGHASVSLRLAAKPASRSMLLSVARDHGALRVTPRFALKAGATYRLTVEGLGTEIQALVTVPAKQTAVPQVVRISPGTAEIPANTLRVYLQFSESMARGQVRDRIRLETGDGALVVNPFLNTEAELWDRDQRRLTLLFDPGRIKQGVGPQTRVGTPLQQDQRYRLVVDGDMVSADGVPIGRDRAHRFSVGEAVHRAITPRTWRRHVPRIGSTDALIVQFDRLMDEWAVRRYVSLVNSRGEAVDGVASSNGEAWSIKPTQPWTGEAYHLRVRAELEDVSGNTPRSAFDAASGTIGMTSREPVLLELRMRPS